MREALNAQQDEPEQLVKMLVILYDNSDGYIQEAVYRLIRCDQGRLRPTSRSAQNVAESRRRSSKQRKAKEI